VTQTRTTQKCPRPPKAPPWPDILARDINDSITSSNTFSRKRQERPTGPSNAAPTIVPAAKRYVLKDTPEKIRQQKQSSHSKPSTQQQGSNAFVGLNTQQRKYKNKFRGLMAPVGPALKHPAAELLLELATVGCSSHMGEQWSRDMLNAAIQKGAHPSAMLPEAAAQLRAETLEKVAQGYARLVRWDDIKDNPPPNLKISPIAAIPHKSRTWRMILDLSHGVTLNGIKHASVNDATNKSVAPAEAMAELGRVLPRLIYAVANAPDGQGPILFSKLDIKDGYWRMVVPEDEEWHFSYVLPKQQTDDDTFLVVPSSLQMGWCDSPAFFCAASETARDITEDLAKQPIGSLPAHPLEHLMLRPADWPEDSMDTYADKFAHLVEVYVDDFIQLAQTTDPIQLRHLSRAILSAIHSVFPPPCVTGHEGEDPVSIKKLKQGDGLWTTRKELLGWIFDGAKRCIELPPDKVTKLTSELHAMARKRQVRRKEFETIRGRLRHACIGIPAGKGLMGPIDAALRGEARWISIRTNSPVRTALTDFHTLIRILGQRPTNCNELVVGNPGYIGYCDASKLGAGGVWLSGSLFLSPIVWRVEWPADISASVISFHNPEGTITNSDLEMAGMLLHYIVLEHMVALRHVHVAAWCDNTPTVSWTNKLSSSRSSIAGRLTRALAMRLQANEASPLVSVSIAGTDNTMADTASRTFHRNAATADTFAISDAEFLHIFSSTFPIQNTSWRVFRLSNKLISRVCSELRGETSPLGSWQRITGKGSAIGAIGVSSSPLSLAWTPCSPRCQQPSASNSLPHLLSGSGTAIAAKDLESGLQPFKSRYVPSARPSRWTDGPTLPTAARANIGWHSNDSSKPTADKTHLPNTSSPSP
jgi:hypothetical protein